MPAEYPDAEGVPPPGGAVRSLPPAGEEPPAELVAAARAAGWSGELLTTAGLAAATGLSHRAVGQRVQRARERERSGLSSQLVWFPDPRTDSKGRPRTRWFPVEMVSLLSAGSGRGGPGPGSAAAPPSQGGSAAEFAAAVPFGGRQVEHELELALEVARATVDRLRAELAARDAEVVRLRGVVDRLTAAVRVGVGVDDPPPGRD